MVDIRDFGCQSDDSVYHVGNIGRSIEDYLLDFAEVECLQSSPRFLPYVFIGDNAFAL